MDVCDVNLSVVVAFLGVGFDFLCFVFCLLAEAGSIGLPLLLM